MVAQVQDPFTAFPSLGGSETLQLKRSIRAHCKLSYLFMAPGNQQVPHGPDKLQSITEELKTSFQPLQQEPDEGRTKDHLQWGCSCPGKSWGHCCDTQHRNPNSGMFCRWCVGRREEMRAHWAQVLGVGVAEEEDAHPQERRTNKARLALLAQQGLGRCKEHNKVVKQIKISVNSLPWGNQPLKNKKAPIKNQTTWLSLKDI